MASVQCLFAAVLAVATSAAALAQGPSVAPFTSEDAERWRLDSLGVEWIADVSSLDLTSQPFRSSSSGSWGSLDLRPDGLFVRERVECGEDICGCDCNGEWRVAGAALVLSLTECPETAVPADGKAVPHFVEPYYVVRRIGDGSLILVPDRVVAHVRARGGPDFLGFALEHMGYRASP